MNDEILYNDVKDDKQIWENGSYTGEVVERIDLTESEVITKPDCKHENLVRTPANEFENVDEMKCMDCPLGFFVRREA